MGGGGRQIPADSGRIGPRGVGRRSCADWPVVIKYRSYTGVFEYDEEHEFFAGYVVDARDGINFGVGRWRN